MGANHRSTARRATLTHLRPLTQTGPGALLERPVWRIWDYPRPDATPGNLALPTVIYPDVRIGGAATVELAGDGWERQDDFEFSLYIVVRGDGASPDPAEDRLCEVVTAIEELLSGDHVDELLAAANSEAPDSGRTWQLVHVDVGNWEQTTGQGQGVWWAGAQLGLAFTAVLLGP